ncbi:hypothetical protein SAMN05660649_01097 [Desulfotomaculum arcticum]|uniref:Pyridoxamine 5'-phosphate oxidase N-terminal domain-containing protein n=1 Tax=Desulfotruncus arcticus DSM 17038 TaxID=1121424 RepID=A0A1I2Q6P2_9FIRM|nr:pyridoxamine 5'-phosphate oxidase family protein [Desulfotruncus arcticus]SFG24042.1 hypothetical protein SAMN05660649_01097 [Desulfotomaculum arcticum] [Desulfotruncus arcticus DSM 17038]
MVLISQEMKEMVTQNQCFIATVDSNGVPSVAPKGSTTVLDDNTIAFAEIVGKKTYNNIQNNHNVAVVVADRNSLAGYRFCGNAELVTSGPVYDLFCENLHRLRLPDPLAVVKINVKEIYDMSIKNPGGKIA